MSKEEIDNLNDIGKIEDAIIENLCLVKRLEFRREKLINQRKEEIEDLLTVMQVAKILRSSDQKVYKLIDQKKLNAIDIDGMKRIRKRDLLDYMDKHCTIIKD